MNDPTAKKDTPCDARTDVRYDGIAQVLHWGVAALVTALIGIGLTMTALPLAHAWTFPLFQLHKSIGITVLVLAVLRLGWRLTHTPPTLCADMPLWERWSARCTHLAFYSLLFLIPVSGWVSVSASPYNIPTRLYGLIPWPHLPFVESSPSKYLYETYGGQIHTSLAWILGALVVLHVAAVLRHHYLLKDTILARMLPRRPRVSAKN